ncbi:MAG TPA: tetratricopeptide repeat protein [Bryobacteraceae bacterium]|nr:tetratricopeptide repeat protein [Bryobacteraceae bacterium]
MGAINDQVFLSYADEDAVVARRIHYALTRAQVPVWGYKENSRIGVDFREEFRARILGSHYFCLLDSRHARASAYIKEECELAHQGKAIRIVCRVDTDVEKSMELFEGQNYLTAIDFANFERGIHRLCEHIGIAYTPGFRLPRDQDFAREVFESGLLEVEYVQELNDLYHEFREHYTDPEFAEAQLRIVIRKCQRYGAKTVVSPILALGVMLAERGRHRDALKAFGTITESYPNDPRGWAGLGGAYYHLGNYESALPALVRAKEMILTFYPRESSERLPEVIHNIASVLSLLGRSREAWKILEGLTEEQRHAPYIRALEGRLLLEQGASAAALPYLEGAYCELLEQHDAPAAVIVNLADCYQQLGRHREEIELMTRTVAMSPENPELFHRAADCFLRNHKVTEAVSALRRATECFAESPLYRAQLAALLVQTNQVSEGLLHARECVRSGLTEPERYYRGLAYYLLGKFESADFELAECRKNTLIEKWPNYTELLVR